MNIPNVKDWGDYENDYDMKDAFEHFNGISIDEAKALFRIDPFTSINDLSFMPEVPFRYYMLAFKGYIEDCKFEDGEAYSSTARFLKTIERKLEKKPQDIEPIMEELLPTIKFVANNQERFETGSYSFGNYMERYLVITQLYQTIKKA
ncbi:hypothetical protein [Motilimonas sp. E26]|uniref:hypothetical protein n=1 Tax=Motilimonas sp. E26 TaxID=2865674 RepID=UPI001E28312E|nr:hypothetical protein [Motilimonas sp. E26]MCE0555528.1 hypothetical protein [Motilimonas sp. E26]